MALVKQYQQIYILKKFKKIYNLYLKLYYAVAEFFVKKF